MQRRYRRVDVGLLTALLRHQTPIVMQRRYRHVNVGLLTAQLRPQTDNSQVEHYH